MRATYWMIGCLIGMAGMGSAMAANVDANVTNAPCRVVVDDGSSRNAGGGSAPGLSRDNATSCRRGSDADSGDADIRAAGTDGDDEHGGRGPMHTIARSARLGWQSLLPGSIQ